MRIVLSEREEEQRKLQEQLDIRDKTQEELMKEIIRLQEQAAKGVQSVAKELRLLSETDDSNSLASQGFERSLSFSGHSALTTPLSPPSRTHLSPSVPPYSNNEPKPAGGQPTMNLQDVKQASYTEWKRVKAAFAKGECLPNTHAHAYIQRGNSASPKARNRLLVLILLCAHVINTSIVITMMIIIISIILA